MRTPKNGSTRVSAVMEVKGVSRVTHRNRVEAVDGARLSGLWEKFTEYLLSRDINEDTIEKRTLRIPLSGERGAIG